MKKIISTYFFIFLLAGAVGTAFAGQLIGESAPQQLPPLYDASSTGDMAMKGRTQASASLAAGAYGKPADLMAKAFLALNVDDRQMVSDMQEFNWKNASPLDKNGWRREGALYIWHSDEVGHRSPLSLPLTLENTKNPFNLSDFNEFWLDYTPLLGVPLCVPQVGFRVEMHPYKSASNVQQEFLARLTDASSLPILETIDTTKAKWKERDKTYLAKRALGFTPDEDWRYAQDKKMAVLQRRLHLRLDDAAFLKMEVLPNIKISHINLMVSRKDDYRDGEVVDVSGMHQAISISADRQNVFLNLRQALKEHFSKEWAENSRNPGMHHFFLQGVFIFTPGEARAIAKEKPVRRLVLLGENAGETMQNGEPTYQEPTLASKAIEVNALHQRMVVDLRELANRRDGNFKKSELLLLPPANKTSCAIQIDRTRAVNAYDGKLPVYARQMEDWSRRWGGVFGFSPQRGQVEQPGVLAYLPLSALSYSGMKYVDTVKEESNSPTSSKRTGMISQTAHEVQNINPQGLQGLFHRIKNSSDAGDWGGGIRASVVRQPLESYRVLGADSKEVPLDKGLLVSSGGAELSGDGDPPRATVEGDLLVLEGKSQALEISWPLKSSVNDKTWFYFGVGDGAEQIAGITLSIALADGRVIRRSGVVNRPIPLLLGETMVRHITLRIQPAVTPYRFKLRELAIFSPTVISYARAFITPLPTPYNATPIPRVMSDVGGDMLEIRRGHISGLIKDVPVRFVTQLDPAQSWVRGVRLAYHLPTAYVGNGGCSLILQLNWTNGKTERRLCVGRMDDTIYIPMSNLLGSAEAQRNLGMLRSIDWVLPVPRNRTHGIVESFSLDFAIEGWAMLSAADTLHLSPLFFVGHTPVFADGVQLNESTEERYPKKIWLPLEEKSLPHMMTVDNKILPASNGLFTLDQVVVEPRQSMGWEKRSTLDYPPTYVSPRWPKWLIQASMILLSWATWKKGLWKPSKLWVAGGESMQVLTCILNWMLAKLGYGLRRVLPLLNVLVGVLALGPGLYLAGVFGLSFAGIMIFVTAAMIAWGAYWLWLEPAKRPGDGGAAQPTILAVALGCAIWSIGYYGLSTKALEGALPLFGAGYALLYRWGWKTVQGCRLGYRLGYRWGYRWVRWLILSMALYIIGFLAAEGKEETFFITIGGLAATLALRDGILAAAPRIRSLSPGAAERIYGGASSLYYFGALVMLVSSAAMVIIKLEPIAEQMAIVTYYCLAIGTIKELIALRRDVADPKG